MLLHLALSDYAQSRKPTFVALVHLHSSMTNRSTAKTIGKEVLAWQTWQGCQRIPNRYSGDGHEKKLARRFEDVLRRRCCAIGDYPCQRQLNADEVHFINGIPGVPLHGCSVNAASPGAIEADALGMPGVSHSQGSVKRRRFQTKNSLDGTPPVQAPC